MKRVLHIKFRTIFPRSFRRSGSKPVADIPLGGRSVPVITKNHLWPNSRAPYEISDDHEDPPKGVGFPTWRSKIEEWIRGINTLIRCDLFVPKKDSDRNYISFRYKASLTDKIGCFSDHPVNICRSIDQFSAEHEALHALGFAHEEVHIDFPWDTDDPKNSLGKINDYSYSWEGRSKRRWNIILYSQFKNHLSKLSADEKIRGILQQRLSGEFEYFGNCDFDSVMMYTWIPELVAKTVLEAAKAPASERADDTYECKLKKFRLRYRSGKAALGTFLSRQDVAALRKRYPKANS